ncbi:hypothetical protein P691DRAFT_672542 [Macrolepiota fuliginosa MF-IS2]|uniref:Uncharacterized protein n=1 Tax=Macrolepiota fuliginosa MF-IS2 TaxID=1400762 RepID=A0A9P5X920_9AGAR|nr:hypothetical protein P691DRAFT_672542 [Macrolepiota fuliginosa MF-IS2]
MKAEVAQLKEQKTTETPLEQDHVRAMRTELEALREQIRVLKEAKMAQTEPSEPSEVRVMRDEIASLKNEMRSLQNSSRRSSMAPSTPTTPNLSLRYNNQTMAQTIHPLAHLLAVEPDTTPPTPTTAGTAIQSDATQTEGQLAQSARSQSSHSHGDDSSEKQPDAPPVTPHSPAIFDDIPLPVKSKRKARMIFSRS